jgi:hypothetical protein
MSQDVWFTADIHHIILAAVRANQDALSAGLVGSDPWRKCAYHQGFRAALSALSLTLGLPQLPPVDDAEGYTVADSSLAVTEAASPHRFAVWPAGEEESLEEGTALVR